MGVTPVVNYGGETRHPEIWGRRVEMPVFEGGNPEGWIFRAWKFFYVHRLTEAEKVDVAALSFDGEALAWFQWEDHRRSMGS